MAFMEIFKHILTDCHTSLWHLSHSDWEISFRALSGNQAKAPDDGTMENSIIFPVDG